MVEEVRAFTLGVSSHHRIGFPRVISLRNPWEGRLQGTRALVKYADDFVVFCESKEDAEEVLIRLTQWLQERGLVYLFRRKPILST